MASPGCATPAPQGEPSDLPDDLIVVGLAEDVSGEDEGDMVFPTAAPWLPMLVDTDADVLVAVLALFPLFIRKRIRLFLFKFIQHTKHLIRA